MNVIRRAIFTDLVENNNKFYQIAEENSDAYLMWGRVGSSGQRKKVSLYYAHEQFDKKLRDGYKEIELLRPSSTVVTKASTQEERFIDYVYRASGQNISTYMSAGTVDALSQHQIDLGRKQLAEMKRIGRNLQHIGYYYTLIPTNIGNTKREADPAKETQRLNAIVSSFDLAEEEERLNQLEAAIATHNIQTSGTLEIPNAEIKLVDAGQYINITQNILYMQQKYSASGKRMFPKPNNIYEVRIKGEREGYSGNQIGNVNYMFHGSSASNLLHILRSGLRKPAYAANGWRLGPGIYFAKDPLRAYQYARSFEHLDFLLLCEVKLGKEFEERGEKSYNTPPVGYNSVRGTHSFSGIDEWTVYDSTQQTIRAVIEFKG